MILSDEQTRAAAHGISRNGPTWEEIERPVGRQPVPEWIRAAHLEWYEGYSNPPSVTFKTIGERWDNPIYTKIGKAYMAQHPDGRMKIHYHNGSIGMHKLRVFRRPDGTIHLDRRYGAEWPAESDPAANRIRFTHADGISRGLEPGEWVEVELRATTQQEGYGGRHFWLMMDDGEPLILRGPWRGRIPEGWTEIHTCACDEPDHWISRNGYPWWRRTACYGTELRDDVFIAAVSRFLPHIPLARVTYDFGTYIEPYDANWGEPKFFHLRRKREAHRMIQANRE